MILVVQIEKNREYYRKRGYGVSFEYKIGEGKSVDLVAEKDGKRIAVEIETGKSDAIYNIRKDLEAGFDEVLVVALNEKIREKIIGNLNGISSNDKKKVHVFLIDNIQMERPTFKMK